MLYIIIEYNERLKVAGSVFGPCLDIESAQAARQFLADLNTDWTYSIRLLEPAPLPDCLWVEITNRKS